MRTITKLLPFVLVLVFIFAGRAKAQDIKTACPPRPQPGTEVKEPPALFSQSGLLRVGLTMRTLNVGSFAWYCLDYQGSGLGFVESPTLYLNPGDQLIMHLTNDLPVSAGDAGNGMDMMPASGSPSNSDCPGGPVKSTTTNMHFHGLNIPPICHQDDIINTTIQAGDPPFEFRFTIPKNDQPGLYWYHPHPHGYTTTQVNGGAAGAIIIEGIEKLRPEVAGLKERVLILRQQFPNSPTWVPGPYQLTLNYEPAIARAAPSPIITMKPQTKEFWRFANATTQGFLNLQVLYDNVPQNLEVIAIDGVPLKTPINEATIPLGPSGRAEFIVAAPAVGQNAVFINLGTATGAVGNFNGLQELAAIFLSAKGGEDLRVIPAAHGSAGPQRFANLIDQKPTTNRKLYFSESAAGTNGPVKFYITEDGKVPHIFSMNEPPAIKTTVGAVEDWTIENHTQEDHQFHIHQIHFLLLAQNGVAVPKPYLADTVILPFWSGTGPYPSVKVRMDFREPQIAGTFVYHCHVLFHEDGGMMAKIEVDPAK